VRIGVDPKNVNRSAAFIDDFKIASARDRVFAIKSVFRECGSNEKKRNKDSLDHVEG
jgi:hypothetical protein